MFRHIGERKRNSYHVPSKIKQDLTNGPLGKVQELLDTQVSGSIHWVLLEIS